MTRVDEDQPSGRRRPRAVDVKNKRREVDVRSQRKAVRLSQWKLGSLAEVSRYKIQLHEQGIAQLSDVELRRVLLVLQHVNEAARSTAAAQEKALTDRLRGEQEQIARNSEAAL